MRTDHQQRQQQARPRGLGLKRKEKKRKRNATSRSEEDETAKPRFPRASDSTLTVCVCVCKGGRKQTLAVRHRHSIAARGSERVRHTSPCWRSANVRKGVARASPQQIPHTHTAGQVKVKVRLHEQASVALIGHLGLLMKVVPRGAETKSRQHKHEW